jgi:uncharacterized protein
MAVRLRCVLSMCAFLAIGQLAAAQTLGQAAALARKAPAVDSAIRADIEKLMTITGQAQTGAQMATMFSNAFLNGFKQSQQVVPPRVIEIVREVVNAELVKAVNESDMKDKQIALYAKYFTHADVKGLIAFYETDLGRKTIANMPDLLREGGAIGEEWAKTAMPGVMKVLEARLKAEGFAP